MKKHKIILILLLAILLIPFNVKAFEGENYYSFSGLKEVEEISAEEIDHTKALFVSPNGNDNATGTIDNPLKTINKAISLAKKDYTIFLREGSYNEAVIINKSYITLRNYPNETARITGENIPLPNKNILVEPNLTDITIYGLHIQDRQEIDKEAVFGIFVHGGVRNLIIQNNELTNINGNVAYVNETTGGDNAGGIVIYGDQKRASKNILITGNKIHDMNCGKSEAITVTGFVTEVDVIENDIKDIFNIGIDIAGHYNDNENVDKDYARYIYVAGNKVENAVSTIAANGGIYVDGSKGVLVERNYVTKCPFGISIDIEEDIPDEKYNVEDIIVSSNLFINNTIGEIRVGSAPIHNGSVTNTVIVNNTLIHPNTATSAAIVVGKGHDNTIVNNVVYDQGTWNNLIYTDDNSTDEDLYNIYFKNNYLYSTNHLWFVGGLYLNLAGHSYTEEEFQALDFTQDNIVGDQKPLNDDYSIIEGSDLSGVGSENNYAYILRDYNGLLRESPIDLGYITYNHREETEETGLVLGERFPFINDYTVVDSVDLDPDEEENNNNNSNSNETGTSNSIINPNTSDTIIFCLIFIGISAVTFVSVKKLKR